MFQEFKTLKWIPTQKKTMSVYWKKQITVPTLQNATMYSQCANSTQQ